MNGGKYPVIYFAYFRNNSNANLIWMDMGHSIDQFGSQWKKRLKECKTVKSDINELWFRINTFIRWLARQKRQHKFIGRQY